MKLDPNERVYLPPRLSPHYWPRLYLGYVSTCVTAVQHSPLGVLGQALLGLCALLVDLLEGLTVPAKIFW